MKNRKSYPLTSNKKLCFQLLQQNEIFSQGISYINGVNVLDIYYLHKIGIAQLTLDNYPFLVLFCSWPGEWHIFSFLQYIQIFFSSFGLGSGTAKAVPRNKFLLTWTIRPNPFTSLRMTCGIVIVLARSKPKILAYDNQFCFLYTR